MVVLAFPTVCFQLSPLVVKMVYQMYHQGEGWHTWGFE